MRKLSEKIPLPKYTLGEEIANSVTHGIGTILSIAALVICIVISAMHNSVYAIVSSCIYGTSLIVLYCMSTIYHSLAKNKAKRVFRIIDHCSIFILIAGTYTPFTLVTLNGTFGWTMFGIVWGISILGIILNAIDLEKYSKISFVCYLVMGWAVLAAVKPISKYLARGGIILLIAGGAAYSLGAILYAIGSRKKYFHSIWHIFVIAGSILHFFSIILYVI